MTWFGSMFRARAQANLLPGADPQSARLVTDTRGRAVPDAAIEIIVKWVGFRSGAYFCPAGVLTIGYGSTSYAPGFPVKASDSITEAAARALVREQAGDLARRVDAMALVPLSAGQRGALISFSYSVGWPAFRDSALLRLLNGGRPKLAAAQFALWNLIDGKVFRGLDARRLEERRLFED